MHRMLLPLLFNSQPFSFSIYQLRPPCCPTPLSNFHNFEGHFPRNKFAFGYYDVGSQTNIYVFLVGVQLAFPINTIDCGSF